MNFITCSIANVFVYLDNITPGVKFIVELVVGFVERIIVCGSSFGFHSITTAVHEDVLLT